MSSTSLCRNLPKCLFVHYLTCCGRIMMRLWSTSTAYRKTNVVFGEATCRLVLYWLDFHFKDVLVHWFAYIGYSEGYIYVISRWYRHFLLFCIDSSIQMKRTKPKCWQKVISRQRRTREYEQDETWEIVYINFTYNYEQYGPHEKNRSELGQ